MSANKIIFTFCLFIVLSQLTACVSAVAVGAAGTAAVTTSDRRTLGTQIDDKTTSARVSTAINKIADIEELADISVNVYNGQVLLTGQSSTQSLIDSAAQAAESVQHVLKVHNQIRLGQPIATTSTVNDIWLGTKIRALMSTNKRVPLLKLDLIVEDSEVFIMGRLTKAEASAAVDLVRNVDGVTKVIRVMELVN
ncbi:BON domain-containing protein [Glaciecola petra]|uniref:BON domain-containing protein n=1 Tax=Glaciecola petra TaxID=3075602 RepID=A0ABU2ZYR3_9ALTE|nr:BON domain-containing protein [Aestuariibacter sp. P117]MDT0596572.1 BON domain-containing protein [Aestuariibacter sp. P117]